MTQSLSLGQFNFNRTRNEDTMTKITPPTLWHLDSWCFILQSLIQLTSLFLLITSFPSTSATVEFHENVENSDSVKLDPTPRLSVHNHNTILPSHHKQIIITALRTNLVLESGEASYPQDLSPTSLIGHGIFLHFLLHPFDLFWRCCTKDHVLWKSVSRYACHKL